MDSCHTPFFRTNGIPEADHFCHNLLLLDVE